MPTFCIIKESSNSIVIEVNSERSPGPDLATIPAEEVGKVHRSMQMSDI